MAPERDLDIDEDTVAITTGQRRVGGDGNLIDRRVLVLKPAAVGNIGRKDTLLEAEPHGPFKHEPLAHDKGQQLQTRPSLGDAPGRRLSLGGELKPIKAKWRQCQHIGELPDPRKGGATD